MLLSIFQWLKRCLKLRHNTKADPQDSSGLLTLVTSELLELKSHFHMFIEWQLINSSTIRRDFLHSRTLLSSLGYSSTQTVPKGPILSAGYIESKLLSYNGCYEDLASPALHSGQYLHKKNNKPAKPLKLVPDWQSCSEQRLLNHLDPCLPFPILLKC